MSADNDNRTPQQVLEDAARWGDLESIRRAIADGADPVVDKSLALVTAATSGHAECVRYLIPLSDPKHLDSMSLQCAAAGGHTECVKLLIPVSDPKCDHSMPLQWAATNNHLDCVRLLIPVSDTDEALRRLGDDLKPKTRELLVSVIQEEALRARHLPIENKAERRPL